MENIDKMGEESNKYFNKKRSSQGAFTPFKTASPIASSRASEEVTPKSSLYGRHSARSKSGTPSSTPRNRLGQGQGVSPRSAAVMSARKSLLGKLTSVAQQHARKIIDRSARQREGRAERMARRLLKRKMEDEEEEDENNSEDEDEKDNKEAR
ncbi:LOW QUALITY PROTEIN: hypothetical protein PoB_002244800 [Plakobranchus ocellatus]|uniref:Uncharacterized protein n=1 Tax=Plakobranchus ocellatus TaxID=259542 RepID=A0AAV3ZM77_9GAST|nr:LOW QUALITY PROTEIN: hypothetical protein PoB_002244800 [Plakobranchus ocellatus]